MNDQVPANYRTEGTVPEIQTPKTYLWTQTSQLSLWIDDAPQHQGALPNSSATMAATLLALRAPLSSSIYMCNPHLPIEPSRLSTRHSTPLYISLPTATVWLGSHLLTAEQAHRRHGPQKERPR